MSDTFDFIIAGAGSAGCVLANRLSADPGTRVLLLEYGGSDVGPFIQMPSALSYPMNMSTYNWGYESEPEPHLGNRRLNAPRGKVLGGSSSINGMVFVRGHARDFDTWAERGATGWDFAHCLPYFKRMETSHGGEDGWRGTDGPLHVTRGKRKNPLYDAFIKAGVEAGYPETADYNGSAQEGFGAFEMTVWKGRRWSTANAYLHPVRHRPNLKIVTGAMIDKVLIKEGRAEQIHYHLGAEARAATATREIILSAGAFGSPAILQRSGIGNPNDLKAAGIEVAHALPGVGANLQDHLELFLQQAVKQPVTLNSKLNLVSKAMIGLEWLVSKSGLGATNHFEACAFIRSRAGIEYPDVQFHFLPGAIAYDGSHAAASDGMQIHVGPNRSASRGTVAVKSADPNTAPAIRFNYMSHEQDWQDFRTALRLAREIFTQPAMAPYAAHEIAPGAGIETDDEIDAYIRTHAESAYHPCGTCAMGAKDDSRAVLDPTLKVRGIKGLRIADSSVFPTIPNGNINAPTIMVAERAADLVLGKEPLAASELEPVMAEGWETRQR